MKYKDRVLVPADDTHKQTITDVYKIFKTSYSKCYDSEEEMFFCDVVHHLEQHSASTASETNSYHKYKVQDKSLQEALEQVPKWFMSLPRNYGVNVSTSLSCKDKEQSESSLRYLEDMGIDMIEYVKLRIGYNFLKSSLSKSLGEDKYNKAICPGLVGGIEDPIVIRMLHMQYINSEEYLRWILRSRKREEVKKKEVRSEDSAGLFKPPKSEQVWKNGLSSINHSVLEKDEEYHHQHSIDSQITDDRSIKEDTLPPLNANEKQHIIMLTQYEVMDQELPDDIEVFWPGKRDLENDYVNFKNALSESILHQHFIHNFKSGRLERLDDEVWLECKDYFAETLECKMSSHSKVEETKPPAKEVTPAPKQEKCSWDKLRERFKDYKISQDLTLSLFDNIVKEKTRLEDLNLCCIISKLKEIHKENPKEGGNDGELIWKDMVIVRTRSKGSQSEQEEIVQVLSEDGSQVKEESDEDEEIIPEYKSMIYISKVYPEPGAYHSQDRCEHDFSTDELPTKSGLFKASGYSMRDYRPPLVPQCSFKISPHPKGNTSSLDKLPPFTRKTNQVKRSETSEPNANLSSMDYITFHTDWSNYPYTEMLDIVFHRHHQGYIYITDVFEIKPDTLREVNRIFHKAGKKSEEECGQECKSSYSCSHPQCLPPCCSPPTRQSQPDFHKFPFVLSPMIKSLGEERLCIHTVRKKNDSQLSSSFFLEVNPTTNLPLVQDINSIKIQNIEIENNNPDLSSDSEPSLDLDYTVEAQQLEERFKTSRASSVDFQCHQSDEDRNFSVKFDYEDAAPEANKASCGDDDYSEIVDFIKYFRFGEELQNKPTNYKHPNEIHKEEKGVFVDLLPTRTASSHQDYIRLKRNCDSFSVNSDDSISLKDIKGLLIKNEGCCPPLDEEIPTSNHQNLREAPRILHKISGDLYDTIINKRRSIIQELRTSFPLVYLYLTLKTKFSKISITGKLTTYDKHFLTIDQEYEEILIKYNLKIERNKLDTIEDLVDNRHLLYDDIFGKYRSFDVETYSMTLCDPFIRHLIIREAFQDVGTNLSFFLLPFIENDRFNLLYADHNKEKIDYEKIIREVCRFLKKFRKDIAYKNFLLDVVIIHYYQTKRYLTLEKLIELDLNWEEMFQIPRSIKLKNDRNETIQITYKDSILQSCPGYSYLFYLLIKRFDELFQENILFQQFLLPELHPNRIHHLTSTEMIKLIQQSCSELCEPELAEQVERDIDFIMRIIWKCELLGLNRCKVPAEKLTNIHLDETINYFLEFFFNVIILEKPLANDAEPANNNWRYNREFNFWFSKSKVKPDLLSRNNLFYFEQLLTRCLLQSTLMFYEYSFHG